MQNNNSSSTRFQLGGNSKETRTNLMCLKCETFCIYYVNIPKKYESHISSNVDDDYLYFSRMKILIGVPVKSHFSRILFSR